MAANRAGRKGTNPDYLQELNGRYFVRVVVPKELRAVIGKHELRAALGPDRRAALARRHGFVATFLDQIASARQATGAASTSRTARPLSLPAMAYQHYAESLAFDDHMRADHRYALHGFVDEDQVDALRRAVAGSATNDELQGIVGGIVRKFVERGNTDVQPGTPEWRQIARAFAGVELEALSRQAERDEGDFDGQPKLSILKDHPAELDEPEPVPLLKLLDAYLIERSKLGKGAEARKRWTPVFKQFVAYLGYDDAERVTPQKAEAWLADVLNRKAAKTVRDTDLGSLRAVYRWALRRKRVTRNPFADITLDAPKVQLTREKGFTDEEAVALLKAARDYNPPVSANPRTREAVPTTAAKRWVPWLCAFTGARVAEIAQLRREDVREQGDIPYIRITPDAGSVKTGAYRDVPLHPQLVELGFLTFVESVASGPLFFVSSQRKTGAEHPSKQVSKRLSTWVRTLDVVGDVDPNHGWRHRLKTIGRDLALDPRVVDAIQGHANRTASDSYGEVSLKAKAAAIGQMPSIGIRNS